MEALRTVRSRTTDADLCDALVRMADGALAEPGEHPTRTTGADRADVVIHLSNDALDQGHQATLEDGTQISAETLRRVAGEDEGRPDQCDAAG